ncbi:Fur family transcriptional regulator [Sphingobacterium sp. Mn56C]|uniref:Fur family transcriptional regulator n=1 Tax=Sphingobacterium sp. Mn56C TaxID=3395261 RepID=UPI003BBCF2A1
MNNVTEKKLLQKNTKPTSMRVLVYDFLVGQEVALSLSEIEEQFGKVDRVTLYRTLKTFEEKGIVHSIQENTTTRYKLCEEQCSEHTHQDYHLHFYCKICKQTTCKEEVTFRSLGDLGVQVDELRLFAKGICEKCMPQTLQ